MLGAEPITPFLDLVSLGDGEEQFPEILSLLCLAREKKWGRMRFLTEARHIPGVYIPSFFKPDEHGRLEPVFPDHVPTRRIVSDLNKARYPVNQVAPLGAVHNRLSVEIARGCARGCRFCHAGMVYRPVRERQPAQVEELVKTCLANTGFDELSFLALSAGDCTALKTIYENSHAQCQAAQTTMGLPSLRVGSVDEDILKKMSELRRPGITLAPEAGSQRLRDVINKGISEEDLLLHLVKLLEYGWRHVKLYFMIGLPTETDEDLEAIALLAQKARDAGGPGSPRLQITASISTFVPKPFTPFQWEAQIDLPEISRRISFLRDKFRNLKGIRLKWHDPAVSHLEGILSRGDRRLADVIEKAFRKGACFCSWAESFSLDPWLEALKECGLDAQCYIGTRTGCLPWSHINAGIREEFLSRERQRAHAGLTTQDCRFGSCHNCGACDSTYAPSLLAGAAPINHKLVFRERDQKAGYKRMDEKGKILLRNLDHSPPKLHPSLATRAIQLRCWHFKTGGYAFVSHLELQNILWRAFRKAHLPLAFSRGFHPLPLLSFGRALPVGVESVAEWFSIGLHTPMNPQEITIKLNECLENGLRIYHTEHTAQRAQTSIGETYRLDFPENANILQAVDTFAKFMEQDSMVFTHKTKKGEKDVNIRPYLQAWHVSVSPSGQRSIMFAADWSAGYLSPVALAQEILRPATININDVKITKLAQKFDSGKEYSTAISNDPRYKLHH